MGHGGGPFTTLNARGRQQLASKITTPLRGYYAALAQRRTRLCNIACIGDSITAGQGASTYENGWVRLLAAEMRRRLGLAAGGTGFVNSINTGVTGITWPAVVAGGATDTGYSPARIIERLQSAGQTVTFTVTGTDADLMYVTNTGLGTFSWAVDGGAATNVNTSTGTLHDGQKTRINLGAAGVHTVVITWVSGQVYFDGIIVYNGDTAAGIMTHDCGHYGWDTGSGATGWTQGVIAATQWPQALAALAPDLVIITLGTNDITKPIAAATMTTNLQTLITNVRAGTGFPNPAPPFLLVALPARQNQKVNWQPYVEAMWNVAAVDPLVTVADLFVRLPSYDDNPNYSVYQGDGVHPTDKGHAGIVDALASILIPAA